jgi:hypothetical protein
MSSEFLYFLDQGAGFIFLCFCLPGLFIAIGGIRNIVKKSAVVVTRDRDFGWKEPVHLSGKDAVQEGGCTVVFGTGMFLIGVIVMIGALQ